MKAIIDKRLYERAAMMLLAVLTTMTAWANDNIGSITWNATDNCYEISSYDAFVDFANYVNNGHDCEGLVFKLTADINLPNDYWHSPIGDVTGVLMHQNYHMFSGTFDGNNKIINGLKINQPNDQYVGLFGYVTGNAVIKNVTLTNCNIIGGQRTGGIAGYVRPGESHRITIQNCHVSGTIADGSSISNYCAHGGIAGEAESVSIIGCTVQGTISTSYSNRRIGGIVGYAVSNFSISSCENAANITGNGDAHGGIVGYNFYTTNSYSRCLNRGTIAGTNYVGSIVGQRDGGSVNANKCYYAYPCNQKGFGINGGAEDVTGSSAYAYSIKIGDNIVSVEPSRTPVFVSALTGRIYDTTNSWTVTLTTPVNAGKAFITYNCEGGTLSDPTTPDGEHTLTVSDAGATISATMSIIDWATEGHAGTATDPFMIYNKDQLTMLADRVSQRSGDDYAASGYADKYFRLGCDISYPYTTDWNDATSTENNHTPIGCKKYVSVGYDPQSYKPVYDFIDIPFCGHFDGANHVVSGIRLYSNTGEEGLYQGLFGHIDNAEVKNVILADACINGSNYIGGIVANNAGTVENCHALSTVSINSANLTVNDCGAIVGHNTGTAIGCTSTDGLALRDNTDNSDFLILMTQRNNALTAVTRAEPLSTAIDITLDGRTLYKDGAWNTLCLPFDVSTTSAPLADTGVTAMTLNTATSGLNGSTLTLNFTATENISAGTPFIIKWGTPESHPGGTIQNPVFSGVTIDNSASMEVSFTGGKFVGTYDPYTVAKDNEIIYLGSNNKIGYAAKGKVLRPFRAHFEMTASPDPSQGGGNSVKEIILNFGDEDNADGIDNILPFGQAQAEQCSMFNVQCDDAWYDLSGRKIANGQQPTAKGIYIHGGKKIVVR